MLMCKEIASWGLTIMHSELIAVRLLGQVIMQLAADTNHDC